MADASTDAFLQGRGIPVDPGAIEAELTRLWGPAAERVGGPDLEHPNVTRIALANLVVAGREAEAGDLDAVLDVVAARFPSRCIVLRMGDDPGRGVAAEVSALCHLPAPGLPQVCSERIILRAGPGSLDLLPGAVRPLLEADLPFVLWWTADPRPHLELFRDLADESSRVILDLPDPQTDPEALRAGLDAAVNPYARDTAWFGVTPWRELVAQFFDPPCHDLGALRQIAAVEVRAVSPIDGRPTRLAAWLVAWLAGQLGWEPEGTPARPPGRLDATFRGPSGPIAASVRTDLDPGLPAPRLLGVTITTRGPEGDSTFRLDRVAPDSPDVSVAADTPGACALPRVIVAPELDAPRRVAAALESARDDPPFRRALPHALRLLGG